jgi:hypothetical protein
MTRAPQCREPASSTPTAESPLPRSRVRIGRGRLPAAAHEPSGFGTGVLAALEDGGAGDQGRLVAFGSLYEALAAGGEVVDDLGRVQAQAVEIDQVDVGALPGLQIVVRGRPPRAFVSYGREWGMEKLIATRQVRS